MNTPGMETEYERTLVEKSSGARTRDSETEVDGHAVIQLRRAESLSGKTDRACRETHTAAASSDADTY